MMPWNDGGCYMGWNDGTMPWNDVTTRWNDGKYVWALYNPMASLSICHLVFCLPWMAILLNLVTLRWNEVAMPWNGGAK